jgi:hypothetical protein
MSGGGEAVDGGVGKGTFLWLLAALMAALVIINNHFTPCNFVFYFNLNLVLPLRLPLIATIVESLLHFQQ